VKELLQLEVVVMVVQVVITWFCWNYIIQVVEVEVHNDVDGANGGSGVVIFRIPTAQLFWDNNRFANCYNRWNRYNFNI
jgi:hypothetical protein